MRLFRIAVVLLTATALAGSPLRAQKATGPAKTVAPPSEKSLDLLLPASAVAVVRVGDLRMLEQTMASTRLAETARVTPSVEPIENYLNALKGASGPRMSGAVMIFPGAGSGPASQLPLAVAVECASPGEALSGLDRVSVALSLGSEPSAPPGAGRTISFKWKGAAYAVAAADRNLIYGSEDAVKEILEAYAGNRRLTAEPDWGTVKRPSDPGFIEGFVQVGAISRLMGQWLAASGILPRQVSQILEPALQFAGVSAFKHLTWSAHKQGGRIEDEICLNIDWQRAGLLGAILNPPPPAFQRSGILPPDTQAYFASGLDLPRVYDLLMSTFGPLLAMQMGRGSAAEAVRSYEAEWGFKLRDEFLASLGPEYVVASIPMPGSSMRPAGSVFVGVLEVRNADLVRTAVKKLLAQAHPGTPQEAAEVYRTVELFKVDSGLFLGVRETMGFLGNPDAVKRLIDISAETSEKPVDAGWLRAIHPAQSGRSMEFLVPADGYRRRKLEAVFGPFSRGSLADLLSGNSEPILDGTAVPDLKGLDLEVRSPIGLLPSLDFYAARAGALKPLPIEPGDQARSLKSMLGSLAWLAGQIRPAK